MSADETGQETREGASLIHRELLQLTALIVVAIVAFLATRAIAVSNRDIRLHDAAELYQRGQQALGEGRIGDAIDAFRRATVRDRTSTTYVLALARALSRSHDDDAARGLLMTLRESEPEDADVNLELARLDARRADVTEAARFYHNAIDADWSAERTEVRRTVRLEFIRFLIAHDQSARAVAELLAVATNLPDQTPARLQVADLFTEAGDYTHALDQYQQVLRLAPADVSGLSGAGMSAFHLGRYALARTYLRRAPDDRAQVTDARDIVESVLSCDPLAARLGSAERRRRLIVDIDYATERLSACVPPPTARGTTADDTALGTDAAHFSMRLRRTPLLDQDTLEAGVDLLDRMARAIAQRCQPATVRDRALLLIGRQHGADTK